MRTPLTPASSRSTRRIASPPAFRRWACARDSRRRLAFHRRHAERAASLGAGSSSATAAMPHRRVRGRARANDWVLCLDAGRAPFAELQGDRALRENGFNGAVVRDATLHALPRAWIAHGTWYPTVSCGCSTAAVRVGQRTSGRLHERRPPRRVSRTLAANLLHEPIAASRSPETIDATPRRSRRYARGGTARRARPAGADARAEFVRFYSSGRLFDGWPDCCCVPHRHYVGMKYEADDSGTNRTDVRGSIGRRLIETAARVACRYNEVAMHDTYTASSSSAASRGSAGSKSSRSQLPGSDQEGVARIVRRPCVSARAQPPDALEAAGEDFNGRTAHRMKRGALRHLRNHGLICCGRSEHSWCTTRH